MSLKLHFVKIENKLRFKFILTVLCMPRYINLCRTSVSPVLLISFSRVSFLCTLSQLEREARVPKLQWSAKLTQESIFEHFL